MASLEHRFKAIQRDNPHHSSFVNFSRTIRGHKLTKERVGFYFRKLVDKGDYAKADYRELLGCLYADTQKGVPWLSHILTDSFGKSPKNALIESPYTIPRLA